MSKLDISKPGRTTMVAHYGPPTKEQPKGGFLNRLEAMLLVPNESWENVCVRLLDYRDDMKARLAALESEYPDAYAKIFGGSK